MPEKYLKDENGYNINQNGEIVNDRIKNPYKKDFKEAWKEGVNHNKVNDNPSSPILIKPNL